ncbi:hypothetical protein SAMN05421644_10939 [Allochromatium warmingii]|uniref:Uncharacterized protein n=1 Tax=Allochromatium warmingii TaxID=61595 RepID=A0A1H3DLY7_ALLWA|nr:hypothetical protein SAMN05421644_10939 [Allochromatium warmingii]
MLAVAENSRFEGKMGEKVSKKRSAKKCYPFDLKGIMLQMQGSRPTIHYNKD